MQSPIDYIRSRSREDWESSFREKWIDIRIFFQENGEIGLAAGFILGVLSVLFFKVLFGFLILATLLLFIAWNLAEPRSQNSTSEIQTKNVTEIVEVRESQNGANSHEHS